MCRAQRALGTASNDEELKAHRGPAEAPQRSACLQTTSKELHCAHLLVLVLRCSLAGRQPSRMARGLRVLEQPQPWVVICDMGTPGLGLMGQVDRPALWGIVVAVWIVQLIWSPLWLSRFSMGPLEWVWRSLVYWKRQPFVRSRAEVTVGTLAPA